VHTWFQKVKPEESRKLRRPSVRCEDNFEINTEERGWKGVDWIHLVQDMD
jgi:hypothetical protein